MIRLELDPATGEGNLSQAADKSLVENEGLETVLTVSLFTDAQAREGLLPPGEDRRGYWADRVDPDEPALVTGSLIWTVTEFEVLSDASCAKVAAYGTDALAWMIAAGAADRAECTCVRNGDDSADFTALVYKPNEPNSPYQKTWELKFAVP